MIFPSVKRRKRHYYAKTLTKIGFELINSTGFRLQASDSSTDGAAKAAYFGTSHWVCWLGRVSGGV